MNTPRAKARGFKPSEEHIALRYASFRWLRFAALYYPGLKPGDGRSVITQIRFRILKAAFSNEESFSNACARRR
jgi:hypothetical protein